MPTTCLQRCKQVVSTKRSHICVFFPLFYPPFWMLHDVHGCTMCARTCVYVCACVCHCTCRSDPSRVSQRFMPTTCLQRCKQVVSTKRSHICIYMYLVDDRACTYARTHAHLAAEALRRCLFSLTPEQRHPLPEWHAMTLHVTVKMARRYGCSRCSHKCVE